MTPRVLSPALCRTLLSAGLALSLALPLFADGADLEVVHLIKDEAFKRSQVMEYVFQMTSVHGPRLTNSPGFDAAADWVAETASEIGLENVDLEPWGPFGRGWSVERFSAHMTAPQYAPLVGIPLTWTPGLDLPVRDTPVLAPLFPERDMAARERELERFMEEWSGKLAGKIVMLRPVEKLDPQASAPLVRLDDGDLSSRSEAPEPVEPWPFDPSILESGEEIEIPPTDDARDRFYAHAPSWVWQSMRAKRYELTDRLSEFLTAEGVRLVVYPARRGSGGTIFPPRVSTHRADAPLPPPSIALTPEHYNRVGRLVERGLPVEIEVEMDATIHDDDLDAVNVVAEILGGDKKDELVLLGGHYDDVVHGTGTTDNATGCAVMLEAMRILKALDLPLDRTVRLVLWSGEEQGLLGSKAYVKKHFGNPRTMELRRDHGKVSAYYNLDNGTGKVRGIYLQGNDMARPVFSSWLAPFRDHGAGTVTIRNTGGTDHLSFDAVGIPGFQFIQDPVEYDSRTHHSNMDTYDRAQAGDLMQAAAIVASIVYHTANRDEPIPRKPLPEPWPAEALEKFGEDG